MSKGTVFWMDEEENAAYPEMIQLKFHDVGIEYMTDVDRALDHVSSSVFDPTVYSAFIIDAHMPTYGDPRFERTSTIDRSLAGVRFCDILSIDFEPLWAKVRSRTLIYTMLPPSPRVEAVRKFAKQHELAFVHKTDDGQIWERLNALGWIK